MGFLVGAGHDGCWWWLCDWLVVMVMVVVVRWGSGWVVWSLGGDGGVEGGGKESGEDVHSGDGWDAMMQWMGRAQWIRSWQ